MPTDRRYLAGLLIGAMVVVTGPVMDAVASRSGNDAVPLVGRDLRRGAWTAWSDVVEVDETTSRRTEYRIAVWTQSFADVHRDSVDARSIGEAFASVRTCVITEQPYQENGSGPPSITCEPVREWRGPAAPDLAGGTYSQDPAMRSASYSGQLSSGDGSCSLEVQINAAGTHAGDGQVAATDAWRKRYASDATVATSCWTAPSPGPAAHGEIWIASSGATG